MSDINWNTLLSNTWKMANISVGKRVSRSHTGSKLTEKILVHPRYGFSANWVSGSSDICYDFWGIFAPNSPFTPDLLQRYRAHWLLFHQFNQMLIHYLLEAESLRHCCRAAVLPRVRSVKNLQMQLQRCFCAYTILVQPDYAYHAPILSRHTLQLGKQCHKLGQNWVLGTSYSAPRRACQIRIVIDPQGYRDTVQWTFLPHCFPAYVLHFLEKHGLSGVIGILDQYCEVDQNIILTVMQSYPLQAGLSCILLGAFLL